MPEINRRQAMVPRGATVLPNPNGTAPGLWLEHGRTAFVLLPGPPREMKPMFEAVVRERLAPRTGGAGLFRRVLRITGRTESDVDATAQPIYGAWTTQAVPIATTILAVLGQIELHLTARARRAGAEADAALDAAVAQLRDALGDSLYSADGRPLEAVVGDAAAVEGLDDCGRRVVHRRAAGVAADRRAGQLRLRRPRRGLLQQPGEDRAARHRRGVDRRARRRQRAGGAGDGGRRFGRRRGPTSASASRASPARAAARPEKPVGTVAIAVAGDGGARVRTFQFVGGREQVKFQAAQAALNMVRLMLAELELSASCFEADRESVEPLEAS